MPPLNMSASWTAPPQLGSRPVPASTFYAPQADPPAPPQDDDDDYSSDEDEDDENDVQQSAGAAVAAGAQKLTIKLPVPGQQNTAKRKRESFTDEHRRKAKALLAKSLYPTIVDTEEVH